MCFSVYKKKEKNASEDMDVNIFNDQMQLKCCIQNGYLAFISFTIISYLQRFADN